MNEFGCFIKETLVAANEVAAQGIKSGMEIGQREAQEKIKRLATTLKVVLSACIGNDGFWKSELQPNSKVLADAEALLKELGEL